MSPTRDRLNELQTQMQNGAKKKSTGQKREEKDLRKVYEQSDKLRELIDAINENTIRSEEILKNPSFCFNSSLREELDAKFASTRDLSYKISAKLQEFEKEIGEVKNENSADARIKKIQQETIKKSFREALSKSGQILEIHKAKQKELMLKSLKLVGKDVNEDELEGLLSDQKLMEAFTDNYLVRTAEAKQQLSQIEDRHKELLEIEKHIQDVRDLFVKMAMLVDEQQESIDRVEYHAGAATNYIELGVVDIGKGAQKKRKYNKKRIWIITIVILIITIIILFIVLT